MLLFKAAKLVTGLRLLIVTAAPIITSSAALLSVRSAVYLVGFSLGSIGVTLWPIVATLIAIAGIVNPASQQECNDYYERARQIAYQNSIKWHAAWNACSPNGYINTACWGNGQVGFTPAPCSFPNCNGKKVWLQTIWASKSEFATQTKSCFLIAYSYKDLDGLKIEYNPFELSETFLKSRARPWQIVSGDKFKNLKDSEWKNLETVQGWDKGYWAAEQTDVECRGWNPGWSRKVK